MQSKQMLEEENMFLKVKIEMGKVAPVSGPNFFFWPGPGRDRDREGTVTKYFWLGPTPKFVSEGTGTET
jgi:hypothetical protein